MAGPIVHNAFFKDCLNNSDLKINSINANIFAQGHDLLLYLEIYNFLNNRNISLTLSNHGLQEFVYNYLKYSMNDGSIYDKEQVKLFLYGYLSHHILDSYFHPFIMQYAKDYLPVKGEKWLHGKIETLYDTKFLYNGLKENMREYKLYRDFHYIDIASLDIKKCVDKAAFDTYKIKNIGKKFSKSFKSLEDYVHLYRYDPYKLKYYFAKITDPIVRMGADDFFYNPDNLKELEQYKNEEHHLWINDYSLEKSFDNFDDIYNKSLNNTLNVFCDLENLLKENNINLEKIKKIIPNRSAITGDECGKKLSFIKYR